MGNNERRKGKNKNHDKKIEMDMTHSKQKPNKYSKISLNIQCSKKKIEANQPLGKG